MEARSSRGVASRAWGTVFAAVIIVASTVSSAVAAPLDGAFLSADGLAGPDGPQKAEAIVDELAATGLTTIVLHATRWRIGEQACGGDRFGWLPNMDIYAPDSIPKRVLARAAVHGMEVYIGLSITDTNACPAFWLQTNSERIALDSWYAALLISEWLIDHPSYGAAFKGWYLPDEPADAAPATCDHYKRTSEYLRLVDHDPFHKIIVAPYPSPGAGAATLATNSWCLLNCAPKVDILAWQDGSGAFAANLDPARGETVEDRFVAIRNAIGLSRLWADTELFTWVGGTAIAYQASSAMRLNRQLWETRDGIAARRISWLPQFHLLGHPDSAGHTFPRALRLRDAYRALYRGIGAYHLISSYTWDTPPAPCCADSGNGELKDTWTADPRSSSDPRWVGIPPNATVSVTVDLGVPKHVSWVGAHLLHGYGSIGLPTSMTVRAVNGDVLGFVTAPAPTSGEHEAFLTTNKLDFVARTFKVQFSNPGLWTFVSELEIVDAP